jgi:hypothetical protein
LSNGGVGVVDGFEMVVVMVGVIIVVVVLV